MPLKWKGAQKQSMETMNRYNPFILCSQFIPYLYCTYCTILKAKVLKGAIQSDLGDSWNATEF